MIIVLTAAQGQKSQLNLIVGTFTNKCDSKGIYVYNFDTTTADFKFKNASESTINPSFVTVSEQNNFIYSINSNGNDSKVSSFKFTPKTGEVKLINDQVSAGADPCYIINDTKNVIVANYSGGTIAVFGKNEDGSLSPAKQVILHTGKSVNAKRQEKPHPHMVYFSPNKKYVLSNDLGTDQVHIYKYNPDAKDKILVVNDSVTLKAGSGPRHLTFSKNGKFVYVLRELDGGLSVFAFAKGKLKMIQETTVIANDYKGVIGSADIHFSPDGRFLYATNRGDANTISTFKVVKNGTLEAVGITNTLGKGPRNFAIDPTGNYLLVAHQNSNNIVVFKRNSSTGELTDTGKRLELCSPVCLVFTPSD